MARGVHGGMRCFMAVLALAATGCGSRSEEAGLDPRGAVLLGQAQQAYYRGTYGHAIDLADSAALVVPREPALWFLRGLILKDLYRFDESNAAFERTLALNPGYRSAHFNMGHNAFLQSSFFARDAYRQALLHYRAEETGLRRALRDGTNRPGDREGLVSVLLQIGTTYARLHLADSARMAYEQAIELDSLTARGHAWLAAMQSEAGELHPALENAQRAVEIEPHSTEHRLLLAEILSEIEQYEAAVPHLREAVSAEPWNRAAVYQLGRVLVATGRIDEGRIHLARADTLETLREQIDQNHQRIFQNPNDPVRWENYAYLLHRAGREDEALRALAVMQYLEQSKSTPR